MQKSSAQREIQRAMSSTEFIYQEEEMSKSVNLNFYHRKLEKEEQCKPTGDKRNNRAEIKEIENRTTTEKTNPTKR